MPGTAKGDFPSSVPMAKSGKGGRYTPGDRVGQSQKRATAFKQQGFTRGCRWVLHAVAKVVEMRELRQIVETLADQGRLPVDDWPRPARDNDALQVTWCELLEVGGFVETAEQRAERFWLDSDC